MDAHWAWPWAVAPHLGCLGPNEVRILVLEFKRSPVDFLECCRKCEAALRAEGSDVAGCNAISGPPKVKWFIPPCYMEAAKEALQRDGVVIRSARNMHGGAHFEDNVLHLDDLRARHVVVLEAFLASILDATGTLPSRLRVKLMRWGELAVPYRSLACSAEVRALVTHHHVHVLSI